MIQIFDNTQIDVVPTNDRRQWFTTVEEVAKGYGISRVTIMRHLTQHADEIRDGIERGVQILNTPGGPQQMVVLYREGVIRLGYFIRSPQAVVFRQWATDLVVQYLDQHGMSIQTMLSSINQKLEEYDSRFDAIGNIVQNQQGTVRHLESRVEILEATLLVSVPDRDKDEIEELMIEASQHTGWDGRKVAGHVRATLGTSGIYNVPNLNQVKNVLRNLIGKGIAGIVTGGKED